MRILDLKTIGVHELPRPATHCRDLLARALRSPVESVNTRSTTIRNALMHVLFDARLLHRSTSGLERVQHNLLRELASRDEITRLRALVEEGQGLADRLPDGVEVEEVGTTDDIQAILLDSDPENRPDVYHLTFFPDRNPRDLLLLATAKSSVVSATDFILNRHPEYHRTEEEHRWYDRFVTMLCQNADRLLSYSESAAEEAVAHAGIDRDVVDITPLAVDPDLAEALPVEEVSSRLQALGLSEDYFVAVGKDYPHKDLVTVIAALARMKEETHLVLAGTRVWHKKVKDGLTLDEFVKKAGLQERVHSLSGLDDQDVKALSQGSLGLVYPSKEEGFGLPPLEAMAVGTPVIAARAMSIPEVCGDGAVYFEPGDDEALADRMQTLLAGGDDVSEQVEKGWKRASEFSWKQCGDGLVKCYTRAAEIGKKRGNNPPRSAATMFKMFEFVANYPFRDASDVRAWKERHRDLQVLFRELEENYREQKALLPKWSLRRRIHKIRKAWKARPKDM